MTPTESEGIIRQYDVDVLQPKADARPQCQAYAWQWGTCKVMLAWTREGSTAPNSPKHSAQSCCILIVMGVAACSMPNSDRLQLSQCTISCGIELMLGDVDADSTLEHLAKS